MIRRLHVVIEKCCTQLNEGKEIPIGDLVKIADIIEQFVDNFHHGKEENGYFPKTESKSLYSEENGKFVIQHNLVEESQKELGPTLKNSYRVRTQGKHLFVISRPIPFSYLTILQGGYSFFMKLKKMQ